MVKSRDSVFIAALLYSNAQLKNEFEQNLLTCVLGTIRSDYILSQTLHTICIDNTYTRDLLMYNKSKTRVYNWPIFTIKYPGNKQPFIYSISSVNQVFEEVYNMYKKFCISQGRTVPDDCPPEVSTLTSGQDDCDDVINGITGCDEYVKPEKLPLCSNSPSNPSENCHMIWDVLCFPPNGCGLTVYVEKDSAIIFKSTDQSTHDLVQTDSNWEILSDPDIDYLDCCRVNFEETEIGRAHV